MGGVKQTREKTLLPRYDVVFKNIFAQQSNNSILVDFLKASLDLPEDDYKDIHVVVPHLLAREEAGKFGVADLLPKTTSGKTVSVVLRFNPEPDILQRVMFLTLNALIGKDYYIDITKSISVLISL